MSSRCTLNVNTLSIFQLNAIPTLDTLQTNTFFSRIPRNALFAEWKISKYSYSIFRFLGFPKQQLFLEYNLFLNTFAVLLGLGFANSKHIKRKSWWNHFVKWRDPSIFEKLRSFIGWWIIQSIVSFADALANWLGFIDDDVNDGGGVWMACIYYICNVVASIARKATTSTTTKHHVEIHTQR